MFTNAANQSRRKAAPLGRDNRHSPLQASPKASQPVNTLTRFSYSQGINVPFEDALRLGLSESKGRPEHIRNQELVIGQLTGFVHTSLGITKWCELKNIHVKQLVQHMEAQDYSPNTIRNATNPLRLAANWMQDNFETPPIEIQRFLPARREPVKLWLTPDQLRTAYAAAVKRRFRQARVMFALCGCAALRVTEVMRLTPDDLTPDNWLYIGRDESKNDVSRRVIPLPDFVATELRRFWESGQVLFSKRDPLSRQVRWSLDEAFEATGDETYQRMTAKDLRKCVVNMIPEAQERYVRSFYGHSPQDILRRHYDSAPKPEMPPALLKEKVETLRQYVVKHIEEKFPNGLA